MPLVLDGDTGIVGVLLTDANGNVTFDTNTLYVDAPNNRVGIGTLTPDANLHVYKASAGSITASSDAQLVVENSGVVAINLLSGATSHGQILFGDSGDADDGQFGYDQTNREFYFKTAGNSTKRLLIDSSGNVGIGNTIPSSFYAGGNNLVVGSGSGSEGITIYGGAESNLFFADGTDIADNLRGRIEYSHGSNNMLFYVDNAYAMRIDSSGRLLVGKSSSNYATEGVEIRPNEVLITKAGTNPLSVRNNGNGGLISLNSAGTTIGTIGVESGNNLIVGGTVADHSGLLFGTNTIIPMQAGSGSDATQDLGNSGSRFKDIYASGTVYATPGGNDGSSASYAAKSANEILNNYGHKPSGVYWIREPNTGTPRQIYCDMETDGGGWMLWLEYNTGANSMHNQAGARSNLARSYNNNYSKYEVMVDSSYVNQINRRSIRGVWELDANGAIRTKGFRNWGELRIPENVGDVFQPDTDTFYNSSANGEWIKRDEYYAIAGASGWSSIGSGSQRVYIREPNPAVKPGTIRSYAGITYEWAYDGTQYGWWVHESSYAEPMFTTLTKNSGYAVTYENGRRDVFEPGKSNSDVNVNNGNNGPGVVGVGKGVLVGEFSLQFNLGYSWGWSEMYIGDAVPAGLSLAQGGSPYSNKDQFGVANNSSNNQSYYQWRTSDSVLQVNNTGLPSYGFGNYWTWNRQSNGSVFLRNPAGTVYNVGTFFGPMKFWSGAQSPHRTEVLNIQSAGRNSNLTAGSGNPSTTLRH